MAYALMVYGSTINGLARNGSSDLDLTFIVQSNNNSHEDMLNDIKEVVKKH